MRMSSLEFKILTCENCGFPITYIIQNIDCLNGKWIGIKCSNCSSVTAFDIDLYTYFLKTILSFNPDEMVFTYIKN